MKDDGYYGARRQYGASENMQDFEELKYWFLNKGFTVILESEPLRPGTPYQYRWEERNANHHVPRYRESIL